MRREKKRGGGEITQQKQGPNEEVSFKRKLISLTLFPHYNYLMVNNVTWHLN